MTTTPRDLPAWWIEQRELSRRLGEQRGAKTTRTKAQELHHSIRVYIAQMKATTGEAARVFNVDCRTVQRAIKEVRG